MLLSTSLPYQNYGLMQILSGGEFNERGITEGRYSSDAYSSAFRIRVLLVDKTENEASAGPPVGLDPLISD
jgi:hypothetical protein